MAFFKFRTRGPKGDDQPTSPAESIDDMRRRARHRLIGATVLVLVGVLGFPMLFDTQPRPIQVDIPIEIPDRDKPRVPGAGMAGKVAQADPQAAAPAGEPSSGVATDASLAAREEVVPVQQAPVVTPKPESKPEPRVEAKVETPKAEVKPAAPKVEPKVEPKAKPEAKTEAKPEVRPEPKPAPQDSGARARALLEGRGPAPTVASAAGAEQGERFVVQVGAFADADKAREARSRLERAGVKTYTQEVQTKDGTRIRVRVGPYAQRSEADRAAERIKAQGLPASVLTL
jgi:DedD protein